VRMGHMKCIIGYIYFQIGILEQGQDKGNAIGR
jgi:hypothetical protein